jgi:DNA uptake protein ComE-like DNA-binding protein
MRIYEILTEAKVGRDLQHAEDLVIVDGSQGAMEALDELSKLAQGVDDVTVKWDGSPAIYFGRNERGEFVLTDTAGFAAKGYDGKVTSSTNLQQMLLSRGKEVTPERKQFAAGMAGLWDKFESMIDSSFRGFIKGDLLYYSKPPQDKDGDYVFTPNTVTYNIPAESNIGRRIAKSEAGVVIHSYTDLQGTTQPVKGAGKGINLEGPVMIQGPVTVNHLPSIDTAQIEKVKQYVSQHSADIDSLLDDNKLAADKMSDFKNVLYTFVNQSVDTGNLSNLNTRFEQWLSNSKVSGSKQQKILAYRQSHARAFEAVFNTLEQVMKIKDSIIDQLDQNAEVKASVQGKRGGEGYVIGKSKVKLVPRLHFTAANRAKTR